MPGLLHHGPNGNFNDLIYFMVFYQDYSGSGLCCCGSVLFLYTAVLFFVYRFGVTIIFIVMAKPNHRFNGLCVKSTTSCKLLWRHF